MFIILLFTISVWTITSLFLTPCCIRWLKIWNECSLMLHEGFNSNQNDEWEVTTRKDIPVSLMAPRYMAIRVSDWINLVHSINSIAWQMKELYGTTRGDDDPGFDIVLCLTELRKDKIDYHFQCTIDVLSHQLLARCSSFRTLERRLFLSKQNLTNFEHRATIPHLLPCLLYLRHIWTPVERAKWLSSPHMCGCNSCTPALVEHIMDHRYFQ